MSKLTRNVTAAAAVAALGLSVVSAPVATAAPSAGEAPATKSAPRGDDLEAPITEQERETRSLAIQSVLQGETKAVRRGKSTVTRLPKGQYVELAREATDNVFVVLTEFGDKIHPTYGGTPGPLHNRIAEPDRSVDNSTIWQADYDREHYQNLYFGDGRDTLATYLETQSSNRYSIQGTVADWVELPYNEARYGSNIDQRDTYWSWIEDSVTAWYDAQVAAGRSEADIVAELEANDVWDRYDHDGDGNFNEADGYIDHFQIVHAGAGEETGGGVQGADAIWSHKWYVNGTDIGRTGPEGNPLGGTEIGDTGIWVGNYTAQPENGGLGVFAHEYAHDLGLPDEYDTSYRGESSAAFWTLMSSGSYLGDGTTDIGSRPGDLNAWDKLFLGWLNYEVVDAGTTSETQLGVAEHDTKKPQALIVRLPAKSVETEINDVYAGSYEWWSGQGDGLSNTLSRELDLTGAAEASVAMKAWFEIEAGYDYLYAEVSTDGESWMPVNGTVDGDPIAEASPIALDGSSGGWVDLGYDLSEYAGQPVSFRFRYQTDGGVAEKGFAFDDLVVTKDGEPVFTDDAETLADGWTADGFSRIEGLFSKDYAHYYVAENRQYLSYDETLRTGPYNFGFGASAPDRVEHFPYQNGLLISYWDTSYTDNGVGAHPGHGQILPIDTHPEPLRYSDGTLMRTRIQVFDAPLSLEPTDAITIRKNGVATHIPSQPGVRVFDDRNKTYWFAEKPDSGVKVPDTNTQIVLRSQASGGKFMQVEVRPAS